MSAERRNANAGGSARSKLKLNLSEEEIGTAREGQEPGDGGGEWDTVVQDVPGR
jgi:hypothetical protein